MKSKHCITSILLLQLSFLISAGQNNEIKFNLVQGDNGKPLGKINGITQDPHGYMWFCGQDEKCLYRYDGNHVTAFRHDDANPNSLGMTGVETIFADNDGMIWIGGDGLDEFNPATGIFKHYRHAENDPGSIGGFVATILKDKQGRLWVGGEGGLHLLNEKTGKFIHYHNEPGNPRSLSSDVVRSIYEDHKGVIWIGTGMPFVPNNEGGLNRLNADGTFTRYMHDPKNPHSLINNQVKAIFEDSRGVFWVGTAGDGLHTMDRATGSFERHLYNPAKPDELSRPPLKRVGDHISFITEDSTGAIWIGSYVAGLNRYDTNSKKITHYELSNGFPDTSSWNGFISRDGLLWVCTEDSHLLFRADPFYKPINKITTNIPATSFLEDKQGFLWVGTFGNGILKFDGNLNLQKQFKHDSVDAFSLNENRVVYLFQNQDSNIWVSTNTGLRLLNTVSGKFSRVPDGIHIKDTTNDGIVTICKDKLGLIWFGRWGGEVIEYNPIDNTSKHFFSDDKDSASITHGTVSKILEDRSGALWIGNFSGINRLIRETGKFKHYLKGTLIFDLYEDSEGRLWAGTDRGLFRYNQNEDKFTAVFDPLSEISSSNIAGIVEDNFKNLWLKSFQTIIKLNTITNEVFIYADKFRVSPNGMSFFGGAFKNKQGQLYIGNDQGFYAFYPEEFSVKTNFKIIISDFFINTLPVLSGKNSILQKPVEEVDGIDLIYNQNNIAFNFTTIDYRDPGATKYFAMLENYDDTWREVVGERRAYYFNVPPGKYMFRIKAFNSNGTKAEKAITIYINPPWWKTWWAYTLYALLFIFSVGTFIRIRTRSLQKEKIILEEKVSDRTKELKNEKEIVERTLSELKSAQSQLIHSEKMASLGELTAGIAHEIQNPLNFVNNFSEINTDLINEATQEIDKGNINEVKIILNDIRENEQKINHHGKRADGIVKGMLQHSRSSSGVKEPTNINALADEYLRLAYHGLRAKDKSFNATMKTEFDEHTGNINIIPQDIGRVILNLITNAFYAITERKKQLPQGQVYEPTVVVITKKINDKVEVRIRDNGNGIPQRIQDKIFQPFFTTKPTGQGTGLGLSLGYDIIKAHGGQLKVETKEGEFAEFIIELPVA